MSTAEDAKRMKAAARADVERWLTEGVKPADLVETAARHAAELDLGGPLVMIWLDEVRLIGAALTAAARA